MFTFASPFWVGIVYGFISGSVFGFAISCLMTIASDSDDYYDDEQ